MHNKSVEKHDNFKNFMKVAVYVDVDPLSCKPSVNIRNTTESTFLRFVFIFSGRTASSLGTATSGISCGSDTAVVIKLELSQNDIIQTYLKSQGKTLFQAVELPGSKCEWYGIVDGRHRHGKIITLMELNSKWAGLR